MDQYLLFQVLGIIVIVSPTTLLAVLGTTALIGRPLGEQQISHWTFTSVMVGLGASIAILLLMLAWNTRHVSVELGNWMSIPEQHFHFHLKFVFDRLSIPFIILTQLLCGTVGAFTRRYLHREPGFGRFYVSYAIFTLGMVVSSLAGTIEVLFFGWELVGLSSALLVAFFHERQSPVRNSRRGRASQYDWRWRL
jgi:NAD(P)H-quinone oxidoreductase subunit 5